MAKKGSRDKHKLLATLVTENRAPCAFCQREIDDETTYGKLYAIGDIQCHYFCVLLSCCLVQKGKDEVGLFGFLYPDILAEIERSKKHKCSYCNKDGATLGCSVSQCRKQFHLPCGRERNAVSLFYGNYKSFCQSHAPKQKIPDIIMSKAKVRMQEKRKSLKNVEDTKTSKDLSDSLKAEFVCVICYEEVDAFPTLQTFWPPCCARDAWFHRSCLQRMALSAGMHYLKCPLCNDKENFYQAVIGQGYYVPDRDAAWELEQNAFAEIYERPLSCSVEECQCPAGRDHDSDTGPWDIKLCLLCGSLGAHASCITAEGCEGEVLRFVCTTCRVAAQDLDTLAKAIEAVIASEQARVTTVRLGPVMPSRMSLRRTKPRIAYGASSSSSYTVASIDTKTEISESISKTISSREELNLKTPKRQLRNDKQEPRKIHDNFFSPMKLLEQKLIERKICWRETENGLLSDSLVERLRQKIRKPRPLSKKKKIVEGILDDLLNDMTKDKRKKKEPVKEWNSPKKDNNMSSNDDIETNIISADTAETNDDVTIEESRTIIEPDDSSNSTFQLPSEFIADHNSDDSIPFLETPKKKKTVEFQKDSSMEISENNDIVNIDVVKIENVQTASLPSLNLSSPEREKNFVLKYSPKDKILKNKKIDLDIESFKNQYLNEVDKKFECNFKHKHDSRSSSPKLRTAIDFAMDAAKENRKRKLKSKKSASKSNKSHLVLKYECEETESKKRKKDEKETKLSITDDNMKVKISLKKKKFRLRIMQSRSDNTPKTLRQYILKYTPGSSKDIIEKPEKDVSPIKRNYVKQKKSPDNYKQMSIHSFFKTK